MSAWCSASCTATGLPASMPSPCSQAVRRAHSAWVLGCPQFRNPGRVSSVTGSNFRRLRRGAKRREGRTHIAMGASVAKQAWAGQRVVAHALVPFSEMPSSIARVWSVQRHNLSQCHRLLASEGPKQAFGRCGTIWPGQRRGRAGRHLSGSRAARRRWRRRGGGRRGGGRGGAGGRGRPGRAMAVVVLGPGPGRRLSRGRGAGRGGARGAPGGGSGMQGGGRAGCGGGKGGGPAEGRGGGGSRSGCAQVRGSPNIAPLYADSAPRPPPPAPPPPGAPGSTGCLPFRRAPTWAPPPCPPPPGPPGAVIISFRRHGRG